MDFVLVHVNNLNTTQAGLVTEAQYFARGEKYNELVLYARVWVPFV